ncbi:unnamed protein product, partial [Tenebrio molitor]
MQRQMNLSPLKVKQEVSTRWNSCLLMMERLQHIKVPLSAAMSNLSGTPPLLSSDDWAVLKKCTSILKPMEALTTELSGEKYTTMSMIIPLIRGLQLALNNIKPITPIGKKRSSKYHLEEIQHRTHKRLLSTRLCHCTYCRGHDKLFRRVTISKEAIGNVGPEMLINVSNNLSNKVQLATSSMTKPSTSRNSTQSRSLSSEIRQQGKLSVTTVSTPLVTISASSNTNLSRTSLCCLNTDPFNNWQEMKLMNPNLYKIAIQYLQVPATNVPAERLFSKAGQIIS